MTVQVIIKCLQKTQIYKCKICIISTNSILVLLHIREYAVTRSQFCNIKYNVRMFPFEPIQTVPVNACGLLEQSLSLRLPRCQCTSVPVCHWLLTAPRQHWNSSTSTNASYYSTTFAAVLMNNQLQLQLFVSIQQYVCRQKLQIYEHRYYITCTHQS